MAPRVQIRDSKDEAEQRRPIYAEVEELLIPGFLSQTAAIGGVNISMRTLFPGDMVLLRHRVGHVATERMWKEWAIASSIWMIDGQHLLGNPNAPAQIRAFLRRIPKSGINALFGIYTGLHNQMRKIFSRMEAFCYEDQSRALWRMVGRGSPAREDVAGVPGVSALGMNHIQRMWVAYNLAEDDRTQWQAEWASAKLIASATSPKGVRRLSQREESERKLEEERRKGVIARTYMEATGHQVGEASGMIVHRAVSPEELVDEMNRWVRGEKDWHDTVIDAYKQRIREKHDAERVQHEERMRALETLRAESEAQGIGTPVVGHTLEQLRAIRGDSGLQRRGSQVATSSAPARIYDKFVSKDIAAGGLDTKGKGVPVQDQEVGSLSDAVAGRRVHLSDRSS